MGKSGSSEPSPGLHSEIRIPEQRTPRHRIRSRRIRARDRRRSAGSATSTASELERESWNDGRRSSRSSSVALGFEQMQIDEQAVGPEKVIYHEPARE